MIEITTVQIENKVRCGLDQINISNNKVRFIWTGIEYNDKE